MIDSIFILGGLLEQQNSLNPRKIMVDTAGASNMIFGLFLLLGYQFSPCLAYVGEAVFCRIDKNTNYGILNNLAKTCVNIEKIEQHLDNIMRVASLLKFGTINSSELICFLLKSKSPSIFAQAIIEVGRINQTIYLLS